MTPLAIVLLALATFAFGLYLGHRWATHDDRIKLGELERRYQSVAKHKHSCNGTNFDGAV